MGVVTLITGGSRSGKSSRALSLAMSCNLPKGRLYFLATAEALDDEMRDRIEAHRRSRPIQFETVEEPIAIARIVDLLSGRADLLVIDCLTLWLSNLLGRGMSNEAILNEVDVLVGAMRKSASRLVVVSGEIGSGIVPDNPLARRFTDLIGWTNQKIGSLADEIILMIAGHPLQIK